MILLCTFIDILNLWDLEHDTVFVQMDESIVCKP